MIERSEVEIAVIAQFKAREDKGQDLKATLHHAVSLGLNEPGCRRLVLYQGVDDPLFFTVIEKFADQAAFEEHIAAPYTVELLGALIPELTVSQSITMHKEVIVHAAECVPA